MNYQQIDVQKYTDPILDTLEWRLPFGRLASVVFIPATVRKKP